jgi:hypothetical protein
MRNQFAVTRKQGNFERVMFESSAKKRVYLWLKGHSVLDAPGYMVIDRATSVTWEEGEFIHEFERELNAQRRAKLKAVSDEHKCLTEEQFRAIVREELAKFLPMIIREFRK